MVPSAGLLQQIASLTNVSSRIWDRGHATAVPPSVNRDGCCSCDAETACNVCLLWEKCAKKKKVERGENDYSRMETSRIYVNHTICVTTQDKGKAFLPACAVLPSEFIPYLRPLGASFCDLSQLHNTDSSSHSSSPPLSHSSIP